MTTHVTLLPGDTTGPEITDQLRWLAPALGVDIRWEEHRLPDGELTADALESIRRTRVALMGYHHGKRDQGDLAPVVKLRKAVGTFANLRPVQNLRGLPCRFENVDLVVVRETTEDIYAHLEHESIPGTFESLKVTTRTACERIARYAFEYAKKYDRKKVTIVHKANIMKKSDGMFLETARRIGTDYPDIETEDVIVDALCMKLMLHPERFDVLVAGNLFGDIVADVTAGIGGGPSNAPSINVSEDGTAFFASPHGDPPKLVGTGLGNPLTILLPAVPLLRHIEQPEAANKLQKAIEDTLSSGLLPKALGGEATCTEFCQALTDRL